jgi:clan AA aspartic protease
MIQGQVTASREATIPLTIHHTSGQAVDIDAVVDTGFTEFLTLPTSLIHTLQLPYRGTSQFTLADGSVTSLHVFRAVVLWDGQPRAVPALAAGGDPLVGMSLLYGSRLTVDILDGGRVTIEALP